MWCGWLISNFISHVLCIQIVKRSSQIHVKVYGVPICYSPCTPWKQWIPQFLGIALAFHQHLYACHQDPSCNDSLEESHPYILQCGDMKQRFDTIAFSPNFKCQQKWTTRGCNQWCTQKDVALKLITKTIFHHEKL